LSITIAPPGLARLRLGSSPGRNPPTGQAERAL
jgi:hypothetical protein